MRDKETELLSLQHEDQSFLRASKNLTAKDKFEEEKGETIGALDISSHEKRNRLSKSARADTDVDGQSRIEAILNGLDN